MGRENNYLGVSHARVILAAIVGAATSIVGAALQSVTRNPLADPHLLGIFFGVPRWVANHRVICIPACGAGCGYRALSDCLRFSVHCAMFCMAVANFSMAHMPDVFNWLGVRWRLFLTCR